MVKNNLETVLVLEDDVRFQSDFRRQLAEVMRQTTEIGDWDLM